MTAQANSARAQAVRSPRRDAPKVLIPAGVDPAGADFLRRHGYRLTGFDNLNPNALVAEIADSDAVIARTEAYPRRVLAEARRLKVIARYGVGTDNIDLAYAADRGIWVTITRDCNHRAVAECAIALMLACAKNILPLDAETRRGRWAVRDHLQTTDLSGKVLGLVGLGAIARETARMAHDGFGMSVVAHDPYVDPATVPDYVRLVDAAESVYAEADVLSLHAPANTETEGMIDATVFAQLKPGAILVNTARGGIVNETDLYRALTDGHLAAAGCDVFATEPANRQNRLFQLPNFVATPHVGGMSREAKVAMSLSAARAVHDVLSGRTPQHPVNHPVH